MAGGNWNNPTVSSNYVSVLTELADKDDDALTQLHSTTGVTNLPTNAKRFNPSSFKWETWGGASWSDMAATYAINVDQLDGYDASNSSGDIPISNGTLNTNLNADKLDGQDANYFADTTLSNVTASTVLDKVKSVDGSGSGLDADTLDSYQAGNAGGQIPISNGTKCTNLNADLLDGYSEASFAKLADNESVSGEWTFTNANAATFNNGVQVGDNTYGDSVIFFYDDDNNTVRSLYFDTSASDWRIESGGGSNGKLWHANNDGSGSGLDADTVDGYEAATAATASTVVARNSTGDVYASQYYASGVELYPPTNVSGYYEAQNVAIHDDAANTTEMDIEASITHQTWETVSPSGGDYTWSALGDVPSGAKAIIVSIRLYMLLYGVAANHSGTIGIYAREGSSTATTGDGTRVANLAVSGYTSSTSSSWGVRNENMSHVIIPINSSRQFDLYWTRSSSASSGSPTRADTIDMWLRGWIE